MQMNEEIPKRIEPDIRKREGIFWIPEKKFSSGNLKVNISDLIRQMDSLA